MPTVINGLPAHVLLVHAVVVLTPLGALFTVLAAVWPAARRRLGVFTPVTCAIALAAVPLTINSGNWLRARFTVIRGGLTPAIERHASLGRNFWIYAVALFVVSAGVWWLGHRSDAAGAVLPGAAMDGAAMDGTAATGRGTAVATRTAPATVTLTQVVIAVVAVAVAAVTVWQLYRVGDTGAHAAWDGVTGTR